MKKSAKGNQNRRNKTKPRVRSGNKDETEVPSTWAVVACRLDLHLPKSKVLYKSCLWEPQYLKQMEVGLL